MILNSLDGMVNKNSKFLQLILVTFNYSLLLFKPPKSVSILVDLILFFEKITFIQKYIDFVGFKSYFSSVKATIKTSVTQQCQQFSVYIKYKKTF